MVEPVLLDPEGYDFVVAVLEFHTENRSNDPLEDKRSCYGLFDEFAGTKSEWHPYIKFWFDGIIQDAKNGSETDLEVLRRFISGCVQASSNEVLVILAEALRDLVE